jgi:hypothetical protein
MAPSMEPTKRKDTNKQESDPEFASGFAGPSNKRRKLDANNNGNQEQPEQPLSRSQKERSKQKQKEREKREYERRQREERQRQRWTWEGREAQRLEQEKLGRRKEPPETTDDPEDAGGSPRNSFNNDDLNSMLHVIDFAKEAEPIGSRKDPKSLFLKHAKAETEHFRKLVEGIQAIEAFRTKDPTGRNHPSFYKRKWSGWQADELRASTALDMCGCSPSNLTNDVHPIFSYDNFNRCKRDVYNQLLPALRLATQFLTHPGCARYWTTLFFGIWQPDNALAQHLGHPVYRIPKLADYSNDETSLALKMLKQIAEYTTFDFKDDLYIEGSLCYAIVMCDTKTTKSTHQYLPTEETEDTGAHDSWETLLMRCRTDDNFDAMKAHIRVHLLMDYYEYARYLRKLEYADEAVRLRFNLIFANTLCHEIAHNIEMRRRLVQFGRDFRAKGRPFHWSPLRIDSETFLYDWKEAEAGRGFEVTTFGTSIHPINDRCDGAAGLHTMKYPSDTPLEVAHALPMTYISAIQQQPFWADQSKEEVARLLKIPKTGVPAANSATMTTLSWKSFLRLQEEQKNSPYHLEDVVPLTTDEPGQPPERHLSGSSGEDKGGNEEGSNDSMPTSPTDPALKKPEDLTVSDKWKLIGEWHKLEGGLSIVFHLQRSMSNLLLPKKLQPWNRDSWQHEQLNELLERRTNQKAEMEAQEHNAKIARLTEIDLIQYKEIKDFAKAAAIAEDPVKAEKWKCLEELVYLQDGGIIAVEFLHKREAGTLDFTGKEKLDPDRTDSWGPEIKDYLNDLRTNFIRKRIDQEKKTPITFPPQIERTSEDERQEILNFYRPKSKRVKIGGLPTPPRPVKKEPAVAATETQTSEAADPSKSGVVDPNDENEDNAPKPLTGGEDLFEDDPEITEKGKQPLTRDNNLIDEEDEILYEGRQPLTGDDDRTDDENEVAGESKELRADTEAPIAVDAENPQGGKDSEADDEDSSDGDFEIPEKSKLPKPVDNGLEIPEVKPDPPLKTDPKPTKEVEEDDIEIDLDLPPYEGYLRSLDDMNDDSESKHVKSAASNNAGSGTKLDQETTLITPPLTEREPTPAVPKKEGGPGTSVPSDSPDRPGSGDLPNSSAVNLPEDDLLLDEFDNELPPAPTEEQLESLDGLNKQLQRKQEPKVTNRQRRRSRSPRKRSSGDRVFRVRSPSPRFEMFDEEEKEGEEKKEAEVLVKEEEEEEEEEEEL